MATLRDRGTLGSKFIDPDDKGEPWDQAPVTYAYEGTCMAASHQTWYRMTEDEFAHIGPAVCSKDGSRVFIDRAEFGSTGSPQLGHSASYAKLARPWR